MKAFAEITEAWCEQAGMEKIVWNGAFPEYWVSLYSTQELNRIEESERDYQAFRYRLGVWFGEDDDGPFRVYLVDGSARVELKGVTQPCDVRNAYRIFTNREMPEQLREEQ